MRKLVVMPSKGQADIGEYLAPAKELLAGWEVVISMDKEEYLRHVVEAEVLIGWGPSIQKACMDAGNIPLKWVQTWSAGVDSLPVDWFKEKGIVITSANGVHDHSITEHIFGTIFLYSRQLLELYRCQQRGEWADKVPLQQKQCEVNGKTMGILGTGAVGRETARMAKAFGMRTIGFRRTPGTVEHVDEMVTPGNLLKLFEESDYVVNILPDTPATHHLVGREQLAAMKKTAVYVNVGRGGTTDQEALIETLRAGGIAFAGLDVTDPEPLPADSPLWTMENVFMGSHNAGYTDRYAEKTADIFTENLRCYLAGKPLCRNVVDFARMY